MIRYKYRMVNGISGILISAMCVSIDNQDCVVYQTLAIPVTSVQLFSVSPVWLKFGNTSKLVRHAPFYL